jgi:hypothetical protein
MKRYQCRFEGCPNYGKVWKVEEVVVDGLLLVQAVLCGGCGSEPAWVPHEDVVFPGEVYVKADQIHADNVRHVLLEADPAPESFEPGGPQMPLAR